jgi:hypothetical protein
VCAAVPNTLRKNAKAVILAYDPTTGQFEVQAVPDTF